MWTYHKLQVLGVDIANALLIDLTKVRNSKLLFLIDQVLMRHVNELIAGVGILLLLLLSLFTILKQLRVHRLMTSATLACSESHSLASLFVGPDFGSAIAVSGALSTANQVRVERLNVLMRQSATDIELLVEDHHMLNVLSILHHQ